MRTTKTLLLFVMLIIITSSCDHLQDLLDELKDSQSLEVEEFATGLVAPLGIETSTNGLVWVSEAGTGTTSDGQLSVITPQGIVYPVVTGFDSAMSPEGGVFGLNHLLLQGNTLFMVHGTEGRLYMMDVSVYLPGDEPLHANDLTFQDVGSFVKAYDFADDTGETDLFNLTIGPEGDLYLLDAGANAIIRRTAMGELSVFATIPAVETNLADFPTVEAVPTGIVFDGQQFLVATFTGFPFPSKQAVIYTIDLQGNTSIYQTGLSSLTDIELGVDQKPVVIEYGTWTGETFAENSGQIVRATQRKVTPLLTGLNFPNSLERSGLNTYYVAQTFDGVIQKINLRKRPNL